MQKKKGVESLAKKRDIVLTGKSAKDVLGDIKEDDIVVGDPSTGTWIKISKTAVTAKAQEKLDKAMILAMSEAPFWTTILFNLKWVPTLRVNTLATDGIHLFWNPMFIERETAGRASMYMTMLCHEAWHVADNIFDRVRWRDPKKFFLAHDHTINLSLEKGGFSVPKWACKDRRYVAADGLGMPPEQIYEIMPDPPKCPACEEEDQGDGQGGSSGDDKEGKGSKGGEGKQPPKKHTCGKDDQDGIPGEGEGCTVFMPDPQAESPEARELRIKTILSQAEVAQRAKGDMPDELQAILDRIKKPNFDFETYVGPWLQDLVTSEWTSWSKPDHRLLGALGRVFPSSTVEMTGTVVVVFDSSGSVSDQELQYFCGFLSGLLVKYPGLRFALRIICDYNIAGEPDIWRPEDLPMQIDRLLKVGGRGGTSFKAPFQWIEENWNEVDGGPPSQHPSCLVYLTDLEGTFPEQPADYPVLWVSVNRDRTLEAPWGTTVHLELPQEEK